ncbi:MAG: LPXTG cell wall anchor domain-containing protein [Propionibacteriaceae bacterium]|nr:LPXTG cell wall anchor domain-containing protein [Propionibacteriaceae bacterium]
MPKTGVDIAPWLLLGSVLLAGGAVFVVAYRCRSRGDDLMES